MRLRMSGVNADVAMLIVLQYSGVSQTPSRRGARETRDRYPYRESGERAYIDRLSCVSPGPVDRTYMYLVNPHA
jgi:hypothetical protein